VLSREQIVAAGISESVAARSLELIASEALRFAIGVHIRLQRRQLLTAVWPLDDLRGRLIELFAVARGLARPHIAFEAAAWPELQRRIGALLARGDLESVEGALVAALDILECELAPLTDGGYELTSQQRGVLSALRQRVASARVDT
jgi:hypothetical protein